MSAGLNRGAEQAAAQDDNQKRKRRKRRGEREPPFAKRRRRRKNEPARGEVEVHPQFDRQGPQRHVELATKRQSLEHAGQAIANAADERRAFGQIFICPGRREIVGRRQGGQGWREREGCEREHDPERRIDAQSARPEKGDETLAIEQAAGDEKAARDEENIDRHVPERKAEPVEKGSRSAGTPKAATL